MYEFSDRDTFLNFGIELIYKSINVLEDNLNKNGRQSFDYLPLSTRGGGNNTYLYISKISFITVK